MRLIEVLSKYVFYISTAADDLFDTHGHLFPLDQLRTRLDIANSQTEFIRFSTEDFYSRGLVEKDLSYPSRYLLGATARTNRIDLLESFIESAMGSDGLLMHAPLDDSDRQDFRRALVRIYNRLFESYLNERQLIESKGLDRLSLRDWQENTHDKIVEVFLVLADFFAFFSKLSNQELRDIVYQLSTTLVLSVYTDDLKDIELDWRKQANIISIVARQYFPVEYHRLEKELDQGGLYYGLRGNVRLLRIIPRTLLVWCKLFVAQLAKAMKVSTFGVPSLVVPWVIVSLVSRRLRGQRAPEKEAAKTAPEQSLGEQNPGEQG